MAANASIKEFKEAMWFIVSRSMLFVVIPAMIVIWAAI